MRLNIVAYMFRRIFIYYSYYYDMATKNDLKWEENYQLLKAYIIEHKHLPDKKKIENRGLLNWWKYNKKRIKMGLC